MAKAPKVTNTVLVNEDDAPSMGANIAPATMYDLALNDANNERDILRLMTVHKTRETPALELLRDQFYQGRVAAFLNIDAKAALVVIGLKGFIRLPNAKNDDTRRTLAQEQAYGRARTRWSRLLDIAFPKPPTAKKVDPRTPDTKATSAASAPVTVRSLVVERAASPADSEAAIKTIVMHLRQWRQLNADKLTGERGALIRAWIAEAPDFNS